LGFDCLILVRQNPLGSTCFMAIGPNIGAPWAADPFGVATLPVDDICRQSWPDIPICIREDTGVPGGIWPT
jgi:hypothetical protein